MASLSGSQKFKPENRHKIVTLHNFVCTPTDKIIKAVTDFATYLLSSALHKFISNKLFYVRVMF